MLTSDWIRENKKSFAENFFTKSNAKSIKEPIAIFMAGLPGAGKTELSKNLLLHLPTGILRLDMDEIAEQIPGYTPQHADEFRKPATTFLNRIYDESLKRKYPIMMDGTFGSKNAIKNIKRAISHGYIAILLYVYQDPNIAWDFTKARKKVEHRAISEDGFIETYFNLLLNLKTILTDKPDNLYIDAIIKFKDNQNYDYLPDITTQDIDNIVKETYNKDTLRKYINE